MWREVFHGVSQSLHESGRVFRLIKQYRVLCHSFRPIYCNCFIQRHVAMAVESAHSEMLWPRACALRIWIIRYLAVLFEYIKPVAFSLCSAEPRVSAGGVSSVTFPLF